MPYPVVRGRGRFVRLETFVAEYGPTGEIPGQRIFGRGVSDEASDMARVPGVGTVVVGATSGPSGFGAKDAVAFLLADVLPKAGTHGSVTVREGDLRKVGANYRSDRTSSFVDRGPIIGATPSPAMTRSTVSLSRGGD